MPDADTVKLFVAVKAFIVKDRKLLMLRESPAYTDGTNLAKYDLPGGRIAPSETMQTALAREVLEETGCEIAQAEAFAAGEWWPNKNGEQWHIIGIYHAVKLADDAEIVLSQDHDDYIWADLGDLPDAAIETWRPVVARHADYLASF